MANSLLQHVGNDFAASASVNFQYTSNVTAGSLLTAWVPLAGGGANAVTLAVSDDKNGSWVQAGGYVTSGTNRRGAWFYFVNSVGGVKPTVTAAQTGTPVAIGLALFEHSVASPSSVTVDSTITNTGTSGVGPSTGTLTVSGSGELALAGSVAGASAPTSVSGGGYAFVGNFGTNVWAGFANDLNASANENATFSPNATGGWAAMAVSFNTPSGGGGKLFRTSDLSGLGSGGPFFADPLS